MAQAPEKGTLPMTYVAPNHCAKWRNGAAVWRPCVPAAARNCAERPPDGTEAISGLQTLSRAYVDAAGQVVAADSYFNLSGLAYTTAVMGAVGVNFYQTPYAYDSRVRIFSVRTARMPRQTSSRSVRVTPHGSPVRP
jgi:hypothetical protein